MLNQAVYNNDEKRILFALSYMRSTDYNSGLSEAEKWADLWMEQHWNNLGLQADFKQAFKDRFIISDEAEEAIRELNKLKVKNQKYDEYINTFQMLARQAKITEYNALMPYFLQGLPTNQSNQHTTVHNYQIPWINGTTMYERLEYSGTI